MKKIISLCLIIITVHINLIAQTDKLSDKYKLDFVIPDIPAFKALNIDPSNILRPSDVKKFACHHALQLVPWPQNHF